jgi:radical SAM superfamily enzyme YgiQ (UPF0313 family)
MARQRPLWLDETTMSEDTCLVIVLTTPQVENVALITPPSTFLLDERVFVNLGILRVAAVLEREGCRVEHVDLSGVENYLRALEDALQATAARVAGITTTTPQLPGVVRIVEVIRRVRPDIRVVLGGPHVTLTWSAVKLERRSGRISRAHHAWAQLERLADVLVAGDGELAVFHALQPDAPKVIDADDPVHGLFMTSAQYDATPYPARHLVDLASYRYEIEGHRSTSLIAQLGCPFECGFCGGRNTRALRVIRTRSIESIVGEVENLHSTYRYTGFMFYDDELNVNKNMIGLMNALGDLQDRLGVEFRCRGFIKAELFTPAQAAAMYRSGFRWVLIGFESGSPRILRNINKKATIDDNTRAMAIAHDAGLKVKALMSVGHPGESAETVAATERWLLDVQPDDFDCAVITTYPGTPYYDEARPHATHANVWTYTSPKGGDRLHAEDIDFLTVADYYKGDPHGGYRSFVFTDFATAAELVELRAHVEASVRAALSIPYPQSRAALRYEHSMGLGLAEALPPAIFRTSAIVPQP